jgi:regulator of RNase E activity RraA
MEDPVERLNRLDTCALSDAMDKLGLSGTVTGLEQRSGERRIAGRVMTYRLAAQDQVPRGEGPARHLGTTAIERAAPGDVLVAEQRTGINAACWGGILSLGAKLRGIAGVIAEGPVRDVNEAMGYDFPIFSRSATATTARGRLAEVETGGTVTVGHVQVSAGDFVVADRSAVVFIPAAEIIRVLDAAEDIWSREAAMAKALKDGRAISEVMGAKYEDMLGHQRTKEQDQ